MFGSKRKAERAARVAHYQQRSNEYAALAREASKKIAHHREQLKYRGPGADPASDRYGIRLYTEQQQGYQREARWHAKLARETNESTWQQMRRTIRQARAKSKRARTARRQNFRKRLAKKLNLQTTTKNMRPTPPPGTRNSGKTVKTTRAPRVVAQQAGKAAPMSQRVKRKGGKFNGSVADKKTATGKKTVASNPEQRRLLAANKKAAQIDARLARTEKRINRMFPDGSA